MKVYVLSLSTSNYRSVLSAFSTVGIFAEVLTLTELKNIRTQSVIVIPGVGNIGHLTSEISSYLSISEFRDLLLLNDHFVVGICLGFQFMCKSSTENISSECLGLFPFHVERIDCTAEIPSVGWRYLDHVSPIHHDTSLKYSKFSSHLNSGSFYFTHSYGVLSIENSSYCFIYSYLFSDRSIVGCIIADKFIGFQFHPEKSGTSGLSLLKSTVEYIKQTLS